MTLKYFRMNYSHLASLILLLLLIIIVTNIFHWSLLAPHPLVAETAKMITLTEFAPKKRIIEPKGSLIARSDGQAITAVSFTIMGANGVEPRQLSHNSFTISYRDHAQQLAHLAWSKRFQGDHQQDDLLYPGELIQLTVPLSGVLATKLGPNTPFVIEVTATQGMPIYFNRTTPTDFETIMDLN